MSAVVTQAPPVPETDDLWVMVECRECGIEWGWCKYGLGVADRLQDMANEHNSIRHQKEGEQR